MNGTRLNVRRDNLFDLFTSIRVVLPRFISLFWLHSVLHWLGWCDLMMEILFQFLLLLISDSKPIDLSYIGSFDTVICLILAYELFLALIVVSLVHSITFHLFGWTRKGRKLHQSDARYVYVRFFVVRVFPENECNILYSQTKERNPE